jgi:hypothetical protein
MFAVVVRESGDAGQINQSAQVVETRVAPQVRQAPGFVSAVWLTDGAGRTLNVLTFASEEAARAALEAASAAPRPPSMQVDDVALFRVLASTSGLACPGLSGPCGSSP